MILSGFRLKDIIFVNLISHITSTMVFFIARYAASRDAHYSAPQSLEFPEFSSTGEGVPTRSAKRTSLHRIASTSTHIWLPTSRCGLCTCPRNKNIKENFSEPATPPTLETRILSAIWWNLAVRMTWRHDQVCQILAWLFHGFWFWRGRKSLMRLHVMWTWQYNAISRQ